MKTTRLIILSIIALLHTACSSSSNESDSGLSFHYDTSLSYEESVLSIDSISKCIIDSTKIEYVYKLDSIFIEQNKEKEIIAFPSQIHSFKDNIKSIGIHPLGDTLKVELIEKEKTPDTDLFCLVWVYSTLNEKISAKYIKTFTGVYPIGRK